MTTPTPTKKRDPQTGLFTKSKATPPLESETVPKVAPATKAPPVETPAPVTKETTVERKRLVIELPEPLHKRIRLLAAEHDFSLTETVTKLLTEALAASGHQ